MSGPAVAGLPCDFHQKPHECHTLYIIKCRGEVSEDTPQLFIPAYVEEKYLKMRLKPSIPIIKEVKYLKIRLKYLYPLKYHIANISQRVKYLMIRPGGTVYEYTLQLVLYIENQINTYINDSRRSIL